MQGLTDNLLLHISRITPRGVLAALIGVFLIAFSLTVQSYGPTWDSAAAEFFAGEKYLAFYLSGDRAFLDFSSAGKLPTYPHTPQYPDFNSAAQYASHRPHHIWGLGPLLAAVSERVFHRALGLFDPIDGRHIFLGPLSLVLAAHIFRFLLPVTGTVGAVIGMLCLLLHPRFWAEIHNNIKDVPATVFFSLTLLAGFRAIQMRSVLLAAWCGALWGLALGAKANALFIPCVLAPVWIVARVQSQALLTYRAALREIGVGTVIMPAIGLAVFFVAWPLMLLDFPKNLVRYAEYISAIGLAGSNGWQVMPLVKLFVTTPLPILSLVIIGFFVLLSWLRNNNSSRLMAVFLLSWLFVPLIRVSLPGAHDFDGIRHWLEVVPVIAIVAGIGYWHGAQICAHHVSRLNHNPSLSLLLCNALLFVAIVVPLIRSNIVYHPHGVCFYNSLVGGIRGAQERGWSDATDYWGSSYRELITWMNKNAEHNAGLLVGVGQHIVGLQSTGRLRADILAHNFDSIETRLANRTATSREVVYLAYITREAMYPPRLKEIDDQMTPYATITVNGATIAKIQRLLLPPLPTSALLQESNGNAS